MLSFLQTLQKPSSKAEVKCSQVSGFVGMMPVFNRLNISVVDRDPQNLRFFLVKTDQGPVIHLRIEGINGAGVLRALRDMEIMRETRDDLWEFATPDHKDGALMGYNAPIRVPAAGWSARFFHTGPVYFLVNRNMPVFLVKSIDVRSREKHLVVVIRQGEGGAWLMIQLDPAVLAYVLVRTGFLRGYDTCSRGMRVRLPEGIRL